MKAKSAPADMKRVVMLSDWADLKIGSVAELPTSVAESLVELGVADDNPKAIEHVEKGA